VCAESAVSSRTTPFPPPFKLAFAAIQNLPGKEILQKVLELTSKSHFAPSEFWNFKFFLLFYFSELNSIILNWKAKSDKMQDPNEDTEWNDILRAKGIIPDKPKEKEINEDDIIAMMEKTIKQKSGGEHWPKTY